MDYLTSWDHREWLILGTYVLLGAVILFLTYLAHKMLDYIQEQTRIGECRHVHLRNLVVGNYNKLEMVKTQIQVLGLAFEALNNGVKDNFDWLQQNIIDQRQMTGLLREAVLKRIDETYNDTRSTIQSNALTTQNLLHERATDLERHATTLFNMTQSVLGDLNTISKERHKAIVDAHTAALVHIKSAIVSSERNHSALTDLTLAESVSSGNILGSIAALDVEGVKLSIGEVLGNFEALAKHVDGKTDHIFMKAGDTEKIAKQLGTDFGALAVLLDNKFDYLFGKTKDIQQDVKSVSQNLGGMDGRLDGRLSGMSTAINHINDATTNPVKGNPKNLHVAIAHLQSMLTDLFERTRVGIHHDRDFEKQEALALTLIADAVGVDTSMRVDCNGAPK